MVIVLLYVFDALCLGGLYDIQNYQQTKYSRKKAEMTNCGLAARSQCERVCVCESVRVRVCACACACMYAVCEGGPRAGEARRDGGGGSSR